MRQLILLAILPLAACGNHSSNAADAAGAPASGGGTSRSYAVADFTGVDLRGSDNAEVRVGGAFAVRAQGPADMLDQMQIRKDGDTLVITRKPGNHFSWGAGRNVKVFVTMPSIANASVSGSGDLSVDKAEGGAFKAAASGSGDLSITHLAVDTADLSITGSGDITAAGTAKQASLSVMGSGELDAGDLTASGATVSATGSGDIKARVNGHATGSVTGSGDIDLGSGASCDISKTGSGDVTCGH